MKKILMIVILCMVMAGCGKIDRSIASLTGNASRTCVDGVVYLQFTSGATVAYNKDGSIKTCED